MKETVITHVDDGAARVELSKSDLVAAWSILENLVGSLDRIGSQYGYPPGQARDPQQEREFEQAIARFLGEQETLRGLLHARRRLSEYLAEAEVEALSDRIAYWHQPKAG